MTGFELVEHSLTVNGSSLDPWIKPLEEPVPRLWHPVWHPAPGDLVGWWPSRLPREPPFDVGIVVYRSVPGSWNPFFVVAWTCPRRRRATSP